MLKAHSEFWVYILCEKFSFCIFEEKEEKMTRKIKAIKTTLFLAILTSVFFETANAGLNMTCYSSQPGEPCIVAGLPQYWQSDMDIDPELVKAHGGLCAPTVSAMVLQSLFFQAKAFSISGWAGKLWGLDGATQTRRFAYDKFRYTADPNVSPPGASINGITEIWQDILAKDFRSYGPGNTISASKIFWPPFFDYQARLSLIGEKNYITMIVVGAYKRVHRVGTDAPRAYDWVKNSDRGAHIMVLAGYDNDGKILLRDPNMQEIVGTHSVIKVNLSKRESGMVDVGVIETMPNGGTITELIPEDSNRGEDFAAFVEAIIQIQF